MRTGISRRWAVCIGAAVVFGVSGLGVWAASADTTQPNNTDVIWTVDSTTGSPDVDARMNEFFSKVKSADVIWT